MLFHPSITELGKQAHLSLLEGIQSQNNPGEGLASHPVKSDAASPQQVSLFLSQPEHLKQGPEKTGSASESKIHQAIDGQNLKECNLNDLLINAAWFSAEGKNVWSYIFSAPCAFMA